MTDLTFILKLLFISLFQTPKFIIQIKEGGISLKSGKVSNNFINDCKDVMRIENIKYAFIWGVKGKYEKVEIKSSSEISQIGQQKIRNLWSFYS